MRFFSLIAGLLLFIVVLVVLFPIINTVGTDAQTSIENARPSIMFADVPQIMIGIGMGLAFVIGIIVWAYKQATRPDFDSQPPQDFGGY